MAVSYTWPGTLPQVVLTNYSESNGVLMTRAPTDAGPAKLRKVGNRPDQLTVQWLMTTAQVSTLETFVETTLKGTARFGFPHPRKATQAETRFVPDETGKLFDVKYNSPGYFIVSATLEILP